MCSLFTSGSMDYSFPLPGAMLASLLSSTRSLIQGSMPDPGPEAFDGEAR
jgi:hypothetical protein